MPDGMCIRSTKNLKGCIVLLFNRIFMPGFEVLISSLRKSPFVRNLDIVVLTDDEYVANSEKVISESKIIKLISPEEKKKFELLPKEKVHEKFRLDWIPKYTFLKFFIYDDFGYDYNIYLDCDIICLNSMDQLVVDFIDSGADIMGGPVFRPELSSDETGNQLDKDSVFRNVKRFIKTPPRGNLNSGVLIYGSKLMAPRIGDALMEIASQGMHPNEQAIVHHYLRGDKGVDFRMFSPLYNFRSHTLRMMDREAAKEFLVDIKLLHFVANHPWKKDTGGGLPGQLWRKEAKIAGVIA